MGWLFISNATKQDIVDRLTKSDSVIDHSVVGNDLWILHEYKGEKHITLAMLRSERGFGWGYKGVSVVSGPYRHTAPKRLVEAMSPLNDTNDASGWGREWLKAWHEYQEEKKKRKRIPWKKGDTVKLWDHRIYKLLRKHKEGSMFPSRSWLIRDDEGMLLRVTTANLNKHGEKL